MYESRVYAVDPGTGVVGDYLATDNWYDAAGNLMATRTGSGETFQKYAYDGLGDEVEGYTCYGSGTGYTLATSVTTSDTVVQQTQTWYDAAGEPVAIATFERLPNDSTTAGPLDAANSYVTASASWYDGIGRDVEDVNYGREDAGRPAETHYVFNGTTGALIAAADGNPSVAESDPPAPDSSTDYIVSLTVYHAPTAAGQTVDTIDNAGHVSRTVYDAAGRVVRTIKDYTGPGAFDSTAIPLETDTAKDVTTDYRYDSAGRLVTVIAYDPKGSGNGVQQEFTKYLYQSLVDGSLRTAVIYPDSTDAVSQNAATGDWSITSGTDHTLTTYDWLGRTTTSTDERGVAHEYLYDSAGRLSANVVTSLGVTSQNVDGSVMAIVTGYDDLSRVESVTSYNTNNAALWDPSDPSYVVNQDVDAYDGWGNLAQQWQSPNGPVNGSTPSVQYVCDDGAGTTGVAAFMRLAALVYPNGRIIHYEYNPGADDALSRVSAVADDDGSGNAGQVDAAYTYLGAETIASEYCDLGAGTFNGTSYGDLQVGLDYSSNGFGGFDRFGRVSDQCWSMYGGSSAGSLSELGKLDEYQYGYDADSNVHSRINALDSVMSEFYQYNGLNELTDFQRGASEAPVGTAANEEQYTLDAMGNFSQADENGTIQERTANAANEISGISGGSVTPSYDLAGNMTTMPQPGSDATAWTASTTAGTGSSRSRAASRSWPNINTTGLAGS